MPTRLGPRRFVVAAACSLARCGRDQVYTRARRALRSLLAPPRSLTAVGGPRPQASRDLAAQRSNLTSKFSNQSDVSRESSETIRLRQQLQIAELQMQLAAAEKRDREGRR